MKTVIAGLLLALLITMPAEQAPAQNNVLGGAVVGGAIGGIIGGAATGRGSGVAIGVAVGAATGALIAQQAERRHTGYYWWRGECFYKDRHGRWIRVARSRC
ncbi:MAG TPA: glycine zipper domain-containing protein [Xanthobacteraceae bacterium]|nr:glycine zipper domain-containing protein [Xanthobacteraceae bacterium]